MPNTHDTVMLRMLELYRLDGDILKWKSNNKKTLPLITDILTSYIENGGGTDTSPSAIEAELKKRLVPSNTTTDVAYATRKLSAYDTRILKRLRWAGIEGNVKLYVVTTPATHTVAQVEDPSKLHQALAAHGVLADWDAGYYHVLREAEANNDLLQVVGVSVDRNGTIVVPSYDTYLAGVVDIIHTARNLRIPEPLRLSNDPSVYNFTYFDLDDVGEGDCQDWLDWELAMPEYCRPVWRAWFYSIFVAKNEGRQYCWLMGQGFDGKSQVGKAIREILGKQSTASINKSAMSNQFGFSGLYGKRFVLYGDCRNPMVSHQERVHQITGGDIVSIEFKNQTAFAGKIYGKMLVCANTQPSVNYHERNERTRIIYIPLFDPPEDVRRKYCLTNADGSLAKDADGHEVGIGYPLKARMVEQSSAYLALCQSSYEELCPADSELVLPAEMLQMIESSCVSGEVVNYSEFVKQELTIDPDGFAESHKLRELYSDFLEKKTDDFGFGGLLRYLNTSYSCKKSRRRVGKERQYVIQGVVIGKPKDANTGHSNL